MKTTNIPSKTFNLITVEAQNLKRGDAIYGQRNGIFPHVIEKPITCVGITVVKFSGFTEAVPKGHKYQVVNFLPLQSETMHLF